MHPKFAVIDVVGDDPVVIVGSYNRTDAGAYDNDENTLTIHDRALARAYHTDRHAQDNIAFLTSQLHRGTDV